MLSLHLHLPLPLLIYINVGTGTPEPGGWTTRELLTVLAGLSGLRVVGGDVVEVAPAYDTHPGDTTVIAAAEIALSLIELLVATPVRSLQDTEVEVDV